MTRQPASPPPAWHAQSAAAVLAALGSRRQGLTAAEATARLNEQGPNRLTPPPARSAWRRLLAQFNNLLIYVLLAAAAVTASLAHWLDTAVILGVVLVNAAIGFLQEGRAERALEAIGQLLAPTASVLRDGRRLPVPAESLVPGDVVLLVAGDRVPADLRLLEARNLRLNEAVLTGESLPVSKHTEPVAAEAALGERLDMSYSGTLVVAGQARGVVTATGDATELGRVGSLLAQVQPLQTPLLLQLAQFGRWLTAAILALAVVTFGVGWAGYGRPAEEMFLAAVGLAVAAIPEGLPAILTVTLAIGVERMARRRAIIRRLPAVETLGSVGVICADKTGTFTRNEMMVQTVLTAEARLQVTGEGYRPEGALCRDAEPVDPPGDPVLPRLLQAGLLCNDAGLLRRGDDWVAEGDPMEAALQTLACKAGLDPGLVHGDWPRSDEIPFETDRRFMATLHHDHAGHVHAFVKGAPEVVLARCRSEARAAGARPLRTDWWHAQVAALAADGARVLALATRAMPAGTQVLAETDVADLVLLGCVALADPPRAEAVQAVRRCREAGIQVKMITGDHAGTARAVARQLGLGAAPEVMTGADLDALTPAELARRAATVQVFARTSPEHKLRLVEALQAGGAVVAMTGDGVNDAPALKRADVGIAMGRQGSAAAREAAEVVLADDNFASIADAVEEGRAVYDNLRKAILFILPTSGGEAFTIVMAVALGSMLPITAVQILWVNMITTVTLSLAFAFEAAEPDVMRRVPRAPRAPLLSRLLAWRIVFVSALLVLGVFGVFAWCQGAGLELPAARTAAVNTLVLFELFYLFNVRRLNGSALHGLAGREARVTWLAVLGVLVFQWLFTYAPFMHLAFDSRPLAPAIWLLATAVAASIFVLVELEKWLVARWWPDREVTAAP